MKKQRILSTPIQLTSSTSSASSSTAYSLPQLLFLHQLFLAYLNNLVIHASNSLQLNFHLSQMEMIGAEIYILKTSTKRLRNLIGVVGLVVASTKELFYLYHADYLPPPPPPSSSSSSSTVGPTLSTEQEESPKTEQKQAEMENLDQKEKRNNQRPLKLFSKEWLKNNPIIKVKKEEITFAMIISTTHQPQQEQQTEIQSTKGKSYHYPSRVTLPSAFPTPPMKELISLYQQSHNFISSPLSKINTIIEQDDDELEEERLEEVESNSDDVSENQNEEGMVDTEDGEPNEMETGEAGEELTVKQPTKESDEENIVVNEALEDSGFLSFNNNHDDDEKEKNPEKFSQMEIIEPFLPLNSNVISSELQIESSLRKILIIKGKKVIEQI